MVFNSKLAVASLFQQRYPIDVPYIFHRLSIVVSTVKKDGISMGNLWFEFE
jgi:hypothetical protein